MITEADEAGGHARILLIEDNPRVAMLVAETLKASWRGRLVITHAEQLGDALDELLDHGAACVLLGVGAEDRDLLEPLARIRSAAPDAAIVVLTGERDDARAVQAIRAGAQDLLVKRDLSPAQLGRAVRLAIERKHTEVQLAHLALHDPLTGLPNRALFLDRLSVALDRSRRTSGRIAVLFVDVDRFKQVNDTLGHAAGDRVLEVLGERLRGMLRPMDTVARFGGDEFTLLFEELDNEREVVLIAERVSRAAKLPIPLDDGDATVTVSIGIATVNDPMVPPEMVIREADTAMYRAKELGRARYEMFDESSRQRTMERLELEAALSHALERSELRVFYQPRIELADRRLAGFEALIRWEHPELGMIPPAEFLPLAEETGLVLRMGEFVLADALRQVARWRELGADLTVSVNLSARQLADTGLAALLAEALSASDVDPAALYLEVSDGAMSANPEVAGRSLRALKVTGVKISLDDYGTGATPLDQLRTMPVDELKIHESFVTGLGAGGNGEKVVAAVVGLAHALGMDVFAEGVETDAQLSELSAIGCDGAQGFLLGAPVPGETAEALLAHGSPG